MTYPPILEDNSSECLSAIVVIETQKYLEIVEEIYKNKGGIKGQRAPLKTKTGIRIRNRMVKDITNGAILPPIVLGMIVSEDDYEKIKGLTDLNNIIEYIQSVEKECISIIDGMQRTTAILEANDLLSNTKANPVRVEVWVAKSVGRLIYRMLVLNTGQVPWDIKRQLETIYSPILSELKKEHIPDLTLLSIDDSQTRTEAGEYHSHRIIEFFLAFTSRKVKVDLKEKVAEDFVKMDATEATSSIYFIEHFKKTLTLLVKLDQSFSKYKPHLHSSNDSSRFRVGKDILQSTPACMGFIAAVSIKIYGLPGYPFDDQKSEDAMSKLTNCMELFFNKLSSMDEDSLGVYLDFMALNEKLNIKTSKVGDYEREFFLKAFTTLLNNNHDLPSMYPCWSSL